MSTGEDSGPIHPIPTKTNKRYLFYKKHHGHDPDAAQWLPELSHEEEFQIFFTADEKDIVDDGGRLYGVRVDAGQKVLYLGTRNEQIAKFPVPRSATVWHGYPHYPLKAAGAENRQGEEDRPSKRVFMKMENAGLISARDRKRLMKGDYA